jgi:hypothetical protein
MVKHEFHNPENLMKKSKYLIGTAQLILCVAMIAILSGCIGVEGPGYVGPPGVVDVGVFGGWGGHYDHGHDRDFSHRGAVSRGGGHFGGHR